MPPIARWEYGYKAPTHTREFLLMDLFTQPQYWFANATIEARCKKRQASRLFWCDWKSSSRKPATRNPPRNGERLNALEGGRVLDI